MRCSQIALLAGAAASRLALAQGFSTYKELIAGADNSAAIAYNSLDPRSNAIFLYIQIVSGQDYSSLIQDFNTLASNYGAHNVSLIPRVRYGLDDGGDISTEPDDLSLVKSDVAAWADVFAEALSSQTIRIPVVQAGFLGQWGEWHDGPLCDDDEAKKAVIETFKTANLKVAMRYPPDHKRLGYENDTLVTLHNDCIFNGGFDGYDGGTFPADDRQAWVDYTIKVAAGSSSSSGWYGGEGCNQADDSTFDWTDFEAVCAEDGTGLKAYVEKFGIAYFNPGNPAPFYEMFNDANYADCVDAIGEALLSNQ